MSFGGQSNAPWQRNMMQGHLQSGGFHQSTPMFMPNTQQNNMAAFGHGGMQGGGNGTMYPGGGAGGGGNSVAYPQPRSGLNPVAFQQGGGQSHYNSIGTVTKISNDCGLINDEIFFYRNVCKGQEPKLGDRVMFEATFSSNGQFKWNATRVQLLQQQQPQSLMGSSKGGYGSVAPANDYQRGQLRHNSPKRSPIRGRHERDRRERERERIHHSRDRDDAEHERKRRREEHGRSRDRLTSVNSRGGASVNDGRGQSGRNEIERDRAESRKKEREIADREREERERERERARERELQVAGTKGRRARAIRRYTVHIPNVLLSHKSASVQDLRQRYTTLYIPSDFFHANIKWSETFTPDNPFSLRRPCQFHIMHKQVDSPVEQSMDLLEPADANYIYSAKVMLMALPPIAEIYKKCFENDDDDIDHQAVHPSRLINFLVGLRGRNEPMAIGGPWSPSLDGENPDKDPSVLIRTAIRTCKALTGIDLSNCTQWYRFVELYYHRTEYKNMEKDGPPRVETVVLYLPDVHSCIPSTKEWQTLTQVYKNAADDVIARRAALVAAAATNSTDDNDKTNDVEMADSTLACEGEKDAEKSFDSEQSVQIIDDEIVESQQEEDKKDDSIISASDGAIAVDTEEYPDPDGAEGVEHKPVETNAEAEDENDEPAPEPTHYSLLDLKTMKVQDMRDELLARNLPDKGVRNVVMARLAKALNTEKAEEMRNKGKNKQQTPQKSDGAKKLNDSASKRKRNEEKTDEIQTDVTEKKPGKKVTDTKVSNDKNSKTKTTDEKKISANKEKTDKEEQEDWADIIDFEMSDIVILDEYDSSKNPEVENISKAMSEREKAQLIRRYTLPTNPQIIVHPNRLAKGGKFDCAIMSLSVLLDYRPDDTKERLFEVSLFAELFNEMLMRDFAFNIYKEIYLYEESTHSNECADVKAEDDVKNEKTDSSNDAKKNDKTKEIKQEVKEKDDEKEKPSKKETKSTNETSNSEKQNKEQHNDETQSMKSESRKRKRSTSNSIANGKDKDKESSATDKKMIVVKPQLLLSFVYFDTTHCGYIFEKDLEDLFMVIGLNLSRSQIKKVLGKLATRQAVYYRKLTDKEESTEYIPCIEDVDDLPSEELQRIATGNNKYEFVFGNSEVYNQLSTIDNEESKEGLINYNGTVVHVGKLVNQIKRTEKNYSDLEKLYNDLLKQLSDLQNDHKMQKNQIKNLTSNNKTITRKLTDANQDLYSLNRKYRDQNATLSYIYTRVSPYFTRDEDRNKETKGESSRDKEKDEKEVEKDKSKNKEDKDAKNKKDEKDKEKPKEEKEKAKVRDDKEKENIKDDKEKDKNDIKENFKIEKEKSKDDIGKDKPKDDKENDIPKDIKEKEKPKDVKEKEKPKDDKEKDKLKDEKEKEKPKDDKEKEKPKDDKEKEKPKEDKEKEKPKDDKEKEKTKDKLAAKQIIKDKEILPKEKKMVLNVSQKDDNKTKKVSDIRTSGKVIKKADNTNAKK